MQIDFNPLMAIFWDVPIARLVIFSQTSTAFFPLPSPSTQLDKWKLSESFQRKAKESNYVLRVVSCHVSLAHNIKTWRISLKWEKIGLHGDLLSWKGICSSLLLHDCLCQENVCEGVVSHEEYKSLRNHLCM